MLPITERMQATAADERIERADAAWIDSGAATDAHSDVSADADSAASASNGQGRGGLLLSMKRRGFFNTTQD